MGRNLVHFLGLIFATNAPFQLSDLVLKFFKIYLDLQQVSLAKKREKEKMLERLVIHGMLINIHELSSLASIFKLTGLLSTVSSKLELAIVKEHRRALLRCIIVLSKHMIGYWFFG